MANANPAQSMGQVSVRFTRQKAIGKPDSGCFMTTHYNMTLHQADREGVIRLDKDGKITEILLDGANIDIPESLRAEDIFRLEPEVVVPLTKAGIRGIDRKLG